MMQLRAASAIVQAIVMHVYLPAAGGDNTRPILHHRWVATMASIKNIVLQVNV